MHAPQTEETRQFARTMARVFGLPEDLDLDTQLETLGHPPCQDDNPFDNPLFAELLDNPLFSELWDKPKGERSDAFPFAPAAVITRIVTSVKVGKDGAVKIVKSGHILAEEKLDRLGNPELADEIRDYRATSQSLAAGEKEKFWLEKEIEDLRQFVAVEPTLIEHEIKRCFPQGTAGQTVDIICCSHTPGEISYELFVNGSPDEITAVDKELGQAIVARRQAVERARTDISAKTARQDELELKIADSRRVLPMLRQKIQRLFEGLDLAKLRHRLGGYFAGVAFNDQGQTVLLVRQEVNEELTELSAEAKRQLIARHLAGEEISRTAQEALGIKEAIRAVNKAIAKTAKTAPKLTALKAKPARKIKTAKIAEAVSVAEFAAAPKKGEKPLPKEIQGAMGLP